MASRANECVHDYICPLVCLSDWHRQYQTFRFPFAIRRELLKRRICNPEKKHCSEKEERQKWTRSGDTDSPNMGGDGKF